MLASYVLLVLAAIEHVIAMNFVIREPVITLPAAKRINATGMHRVLDADRKRATTLSAKLRGDRGKRTRRDGNVPVTNQVVTYTIDVGIGNPATTYTFLINTGCGDTAVAGGKPFRSSTPSTNRISSTCANVNNGNCNTPESGLDGVLGLAPTSSNSLTPTILDNLFAQGVISADQAGVNFNPTRSATAQANGQLTFGGVDSTQITGPITFAPITQTSPSSEFWGFDQSITYGTTGLPIVPQTSGILDTATTLLLLSSDAFRRYQTATNAVFDNDTGLLKLTSSQFASLQSLFFHINGATFEFTANAQIWPRNLNALIGGTSDNVYLIVNDIGTPSGEGLDFINGLVFLERFYAILDVSNHRIGFANTPNTASTIN